MTTVTTLAAFGDIDAGFADGELLDLDGDLFGVAGSTVGGGRVGVVYEAVATGSGGDALTVLATISGQPSGALIADAAGDLFGTTRFGGQNGDGSVFELVHAGAGYSLTTLASLGGAAGSEPFAGLVADARGDLFGTTLNGHQGGTVFEIVKNDAGYAPAPVVLTTFTPLEGAASTAPLLIDANGDLFGTTDGDGPNNGAVFELAAQNGAYVANATPTILATFPDSGGIDSPRTGLAMDAAGDLFGALSIDSGSQGDGGSVFELKRAGAGYDSAPATLATFTGVIDTSISRLVLDGAGDIFGTTDGVGGGGSLFKLTPDGDGSYAESSLASFDDSSGSAPDAGLSIGPSGLLYGTTTQGGDGDLGTLFSVPACYARGTRIACPGGERDVEDLGIGDRVLTASGVARPIRWVGRRAYAARFTAANPAIRPVRFSAGSLGGGLPRRDLLVSPEHAMLLDGMLVPARRLLVGAAIAQDPHCGAIEYFHIELDSHDALVAEGAPSESYEEDGNRGVFQNAGAHAALYPGARRPAVYFAPRVEGGEALERLRRRLRGLAGGALAVSA